MTAPQTGTDPVACLARLDHPAHDALVLDIGRSYFNPARSNMGRVALQRKDAEILLPGMSRGYVSTISPVDEDAGYPELGEDIHAFQVLLAVRDAR